MSRNSLVHRKWASTPSLVKQRYPVAALELAVASQTIQPGFRSWKPGADRHGGGIHGALSARRIGNRQVHREDSWKLVYVDWARPAVHPAISKVPVELGIRHLKDRGSHLEGLPHHTEVRSVGIDGQWRIDDHAYAARCLLIGRQVHDVDSRGVGARIGIHMRCRLPVAA